ncbi:kinesin family member C2/C3 [Paragonimus westermani]|uniref:Kinesin family member C2/C3 n=1 Tax=Paragonimus westermani TaxID=34504 RepID=A0A5J4N9T6_9TREM|nr:kinesin family member C2/C3 [Paragonimus westermani]
MFRFIGDDTLVVKPTTAGTAGCQSYIPSQAVQAFRAYRVLQPGTTQRVVFDEVSELITSCVDGYSVSIMAYGQTGSGKTYTMLGAQAKPGLIPRIARHLITQCQQRAPLWNYRISIAVIQIHKEQIIDLLSEPASSISVKQLGRVTIHDNGRQLLLRGAHEVEVSTEEEILEEIRKARVRRQVSAGLLNTSPSYLHFIVFLRVRGICNLVGFGRDLLESGQTRVQKRSSDWLECRIASIPPPPSQLLSTSTTAAQPTHLNGAPSKDDVEIVKHGTTGNENKLDSTLPVSTHGLLVLSDLAGFDSWNPSQVTTHSVATTGHPTPPAPFSKPSKGQNSTEPPCRSGQSSTPPPGSRLPRHSNHVDGEMEAMEAKQLGRSLITLARIFDMLADKEPGGKIHVPFRDSKLTHLLKPTLTGDAKFLLIVTVNTRRSCLDASMRSLKLAVKASSIALGQAKRNAAARRGTRIAVRRPD